MRRLRAPWPLASALLGALVVGASALVAWGQRADEAPAGPTRDVVFRHLTVDQGLPSGAVSAVAQDALGFVWVGTLDGLVRYDGVEVREFRRSADTTTLGSNVVQVLAPAPEGDLWVGTDGGLNRYDAATETFLRVRGLPSETVVALAADGAGGAWAGTAAGLARLGADGAVEAVYRHDPADPASLPDDEVEALYRAPDGALWVGTGDGLARLDPEAGRFTTYRPDSLAFSTVSAITPERRGGLLVGTLSTGLLSFDPASGRFAPVDLGPGELTRIVMDVHQTADGTVWVATLLGGLRRITPGVAAVTVYEPVPDDPTSIASNEVSDLMEDRQGVLWVATYDGLDRFDQARSTARRLRHDPEDPSSIASSEVRAVLRTDGALYVGTDRTLDVSADGQRFRHLRLSNAVSGREEHPVQALYQDRAGTVWVGAEGGGLWRIAGDGVERVPLGTERGEREVSVTSVLEDASGRLWVGTLGDGLAAVGAGGEAAFLGAGGSLPDSRVLSLAEAAGAVWAGTERGLCRLDAVAGDGAFTCFRADEGDPGALADDYVGALHAQGDGTLWVGTRGGLHRLDAADPEAGFTRFTDGTSDLPGNEVRGIVEDEAGFLWLSTNGGLSRFEPVTGVFSRRLGGEAGGDRTLTGATARAPDGRLYVGSRDGLLVFDPQQLAAVNATPPDVVITGVEVAGQPVEPGGDVLDVAAPVAERITLGPDQNYLTIHYAGLHFSDPAQNTYRVRLDGFDDDWRDVGTDRSVPYNTLPPGRYTFQVQAANADGVWSDAAASIEVVVRPPWWRTWWALLGFAAVGLFALVRADRWQRERLLRRERERAERRETELRAETAEAEQRKAQAEAAALKAENERKAAELERAREVEEANAKLAAANRRLEDSLRDLRSTQDQLVQSEKLASLGQLTAGIAHEIKNPLNFVNNFADLSVDLADELRQELHAASDQPVRDVMGDLTPILDDLTDNARRIHEHGQRADRIVRAMLLHSRGGAGERGRVDFNRFVDEYANLAYHGARANDSDFQVDLVRDFGEGVGEVEVVPQELGRVLINLITNAFYAVRAKQDEGYAPQVTLTTRRVGGEVVLQIADNGTGIPEAVQPRVFEPFFTTKATGEGTGLGLSLAHDIVTQVHGGRMAFESEEGAGTTFTVALPVDGVPTPEAAGQHRGRAASEPEAG